MIRCGTTRRNPHVRSLGVLPGFSLPLTDAGAGAVLLTPLQATGSGAPTFTRATAAWAKLATGLWTSVASGTARAQYLGADTTVGAYGGYLVEEARTNLCLQSRDLSNASWTKTTATAVKDQAGIDGVANSASSLTATAGGGSCVQTITQAATNAALSFFIKRITGTGTITLQQGATTLNVTASINSSTYTRVSLVASVLNPSIGIVLGTNGDKIAVDMGQFENGAFATSPITTTTVSAARNADVLTYPTSGNIVGASGTCCAEFTTAISNGGLAELVCAYDGLTGGIPLRIQNNATLGYYDGTNNAFGPAIAIPTQAVQKGVSAWSGSSGSLSLNGAVTGGFLFSGDLSLLANFGVGCRPSGGIALLNGTIKNVRVWPIALSDAQVAIL